jgi:hypothetical protein
MGRGLRDTRHEKFAQLIAAGLKPSDAYVKAGFTASNDNVLRASASRLRRRMEPRVAEIIGAGLIPSLIRSTETAHLVQQTIEQFQKDVPWCRDKLHQLIEDEKCPHNVRLGAIKECLNRGLGLPVQYIEQNMNVRYQISDRELTEEEWFAQYAKPVN